MKRTVTSLLPLYLAIIGSVFAFPSAILSGTITMSAATLLQSNFVMLASLLAAVLAIIFGFLTKAYPYLSGTVLILCGFLTMFTVFIGNILAMLVTILYLAAGLLCFAFTEDLF